MNIELEQRVGGPEVLQDAEMVSFNRKRQVWAEQCLKRWKNLGWVGKGSAETEIGKKYGWIELEDETKQAQLAMILQNQWEFQQGEHRDAPGLFQDTATGDEALPTKFVLPIVRRVYALILQRDFGVVQPLPGPTGYVFWLDFLRETDNTNILSVEYNAFTTGELAIPGKAKLRLSRATLTVIKQILGMSWSLEALEDARAQLGLDVEQELINAFTTELARNIFARHLTEVSNQAQTGNASTAGLGFALVAPWAGPNNAHAIPAAGTLVSADRKAQIYNTLILADADHKRANRYPADGIIAGYGLAGLLEMANTATQSLSPRDDNTAEIGITDYGTYAGRFRIWGTDFLPDNIGFVYKRNPTYLQAGHVYAPYIPIQVMPAIYGGYSTSTGAYTNTDEYTRNIRERSAHMVTKPYAFQPLTSAEPPTF